MNDNSGLIFAFALTGLLGINVGGIPGTENHWAFTIFCVLLLMVAVGQVWLFKRKRWM